MRLQRLLGRLVERAEQAGEEDEGPPGLAALKAEADLVSLAARTAEKIHEISKVVALEAEASGMAVVSEAERAQLRERVEKWIEERAEARFRAWLAERGDAGEPSLRDEPAGDRLGAAGPVGAAAVGPAEEAEGAAPAACDAPQGAREGDARRAGGAPARHAGRPGTPVRAGPAACAADPRPTG